MGTSYVTVLLLEAVCTCHYNFDYYGRFMKSLSNVQIFLPLDWHFFPSSQTLQAKMTFSPSDDSVKAKESILPD
jgi:hypothetical protein